MLWLIKWISINKFIWIWFYCGSGENYKTWMSKNKICYENLINLIKIFDWGNVRSKSRMKKNVFLCFFFLLLWKEHVIFLTRYTKIIFFSIFLFSSTLVFKRKLRKKNNFSFKIFLISIFYIFKKIYYYFFFEKEK